jgi:hypothetical protein
MASRRRAAARALSLAALLAAAAPPASAQTAADKETARALMQEGRERRDRNDLKGALENFDRADAIMHVPTTGYELARTQVGLGLLVEGRDTLLRVQRIPLSRSEPKAFRDARLKVQQLDEEIEARIPSVTILLQGGSPQPAPAVTIDEVDVPAAVIGVARRMNPGHHTIVVKAGGSEARGTVDLREGETKSVTLTLPAVAAPPIAALPPSTPPTEEAPPPPPGRSSGGKALVIGGFGLAGFGVVVGSITGVLVLSKKSSLDSACSGSHQCGPSTYGDLDSANTLATVSTVAFITAGVGVAVGIVGLVVGKPKSASPASGRVTGASPALEAHVEPWIGAGSAGLRGSF